MKLKVADSDWAAVAPPTAASLPKRITVVDGVRRLEARIHARQGTELVHGGFGSYAIGAVEILENGADFGDSRIFRLAVLGSGRMLPSPVEVSRGLVYRPESTPLSETDGPLRHIQSSMRAAEASFARDLCHKDSLTIVDGPLGFELEGDGVALGYIKRLHRFYLPEKFMPLLAELPSSARTPMFAIKRGKAGFSKYSWFQRLADPGPGATEFHGLVRLEISSKVGLEKARETADAVTAWLPKAAPSIARDPRSPQNLLPIGALEQRLRAELGDARLIRRWIDDLVAKEALHV